MAKRSASTRLDNDVFAVVRKFMEAQDSDDRNEHSKIRLVPQIYDYIKSSNSSLARLKKDPLRASIERALDQIDEDVKNDSDDVQMAELAAEHQSDDRVMNRLIVQTYHKNHEQERPAKSIARLDKRRHIKRKRDSSASHTQQSHGNSYDMELTLEPPTTLSIHDMGGIDDALSVLRTSMMVPLKQANFYQRQGIKGFYGILLHGPSGCGKTSLAIAFGNLMKVPFISVPIDSLPSALTSDSGRSLKEYFQIAMDNAPSILLVDEIDTIVPQREGTQRDTERRIASQFYDCLDKLAKSPRPVVVIATTTKPDSLDPGLRRGDRFSREINMPMPNEPMRQDILHILTREHTLAEDVDLADLAQRTSAFVGADLQQLVRLAWQIALDRVLQSANMDKEINSASLQPSKVTLSAKDRIRHDLLVYEQSTFNGDIHLKQDDFHKALTRHQPAAKKEGFTTIPSTTWDDIGALTEVRKALNAHIVQPILHPETWEHVGSPPPSGLLLWGPPGCGKTLLAKAVANETRANFISIKGPELLSKYVGESEKRVRTLFDRARRVVPCLIFFDEIDALVPKRDDSLNEAISRVVNTLLVELDGLDGNAGVYVIGATNRPDTIDEAMLRPGRLGKLHFVDLPSAEERVEILRKLSRRQNPSAYAQELDNIARSCEGFSGADLGNLVSKACSSAIERRDTVRLEDFVKARKESRTSVRNYDKYLALVKSLGNA